PSTTNNAAELISINMLGSQDGQGMAEGFDFWSAGALAAIERDFSENLLAGISLGGIYNKIEGDNICDSNSTSFLADVYAVYTMKDMPLDIFANFGYAHSWNEASRSTPDGTASIDYDSNAFNTLGGVAYTFKKVGVDGLTIKPMAMYNIVYLNDDSANEEGAGFYNANVSSNDYINVRTLIGLEVKYDIDASFAVMARAFWVHEFCDTSYDANYKINAGNSFMNSAKYRGIDASEDAALLGLGLNYNFSERVSAFLDYSATLRDDFTAHGLDLGVKFKF
ncbi:MAG: autotransporter outer membrane beta-barrel domain-containing protein, partial [Opitutales bacterium]|nr:autotransporter outer membrane beta-barrel domain-containing protein [Opitutales bacterium]